MILRLLIVTTVLSVSVPATTRGQWYGSADFIVPTRNVSSENVFARNQVEEFDNATPPNSLGVVVGDESNLSLDFGFTAAGRFTLGRRVGEFGVEATYLTTGDLTAQCQVFDAGAGIASPFTAVGAMPDPVLDDNSQVLADYTTDLQSIELNLTQLAYGGGSGEATFFGGVRAFAIDEAFHWTGVNAAEPNTVDSFRKNRMIGPQIGLNAWTPVRGGRLSLNVSGAYVFNEIEIVETYTGPGVDGPFPDKSETRSEASLVGELGIEYLYRVLPNAEVRVGFEVLGLSDVGLAANPSAFSNQLTDGVTYIQPYFGFLLTR